MPQNLAQRRVKDPILTNVAHGYPTQNFAGMMLFPSVKVLVRGGSVLMFGKEHFRKLNLRRAPGDPKRRTSYAYSDKSFTIVQDAIESPLPYEHLEDARITPGIDLGEAFTNANMETLALQLEIEQSEIATNPANYSINNTEDLNGAFSGGAYDIPQKIDEVKKAVWNGIKKRPNIMLVGYSADIVIRNSESVKSRFTYHTPEELTNQQLAGLFGVERYVVGDSGYEDASGSTFECWGDNVLLAYVPPTTIGEAKYAPSNKVSMFQPSFGYTYVYDLRADEPYEDNSCDSWIFSAKYERTPVLTGMDAGFLLQDVAA